MQAFREKNESSVLKWHAICSLHLKIVRIMKHFFSLVMAVLMAMVSAQACTKKKAASVPTDTDVTIIVMDSTQALLNGAKVKFGKQTLTTSFDGRAVIPADMTAKIKSVSVSCEGFKTKNIALGGGTTLLVRMEGKKRKAANDPYIAGSVRTAKSGVMYKTLSMAATADMDGGFVEEEAMDLAMPATPDYAGAANNAVAAGKLTAGEVNDFAKWYFWPAVADGSHKQYVTEWRIQPRHRFTVQVTNAAGYPVAAKAVSLLDGQGNTLFQAVTDNTGKAELWYQLIGSNLCGKHAGLKIQVDDQQAEAKEWTEGLNSFVLDEPCNDQSPITNDVDVMFVFDATGSMGDELNYLQAEMKDVIARAKDATGGLDMRTGAVVYRDHGDEYITRLSRLTADIATTQAFIDKQQADGGGDYPEAVSEALMAAVNSAGWNSEARARIAFLVLDAPCHQDSATIALLHEQVLNAAALGVRIVPVVCSGLGESGEYMLRAMALATNGTSFFLTDDSGIGLPHLKPATDSLKVEHLNDMLVRTIVEFSAMPECGQSPIDNNQSPMTDDFVPNPFELKDLESSEVTIPHGEGVVYIVDVSGKLISIREGAFDEADSRWLQSQLSLPVGVYFLKAFIDKQWYTKKVLVY